MNFLENARLAWEGLRANKMRALLTMLGIIIGIASVIGILTISGGLSGTITESMGTLGANNIMVYLQVKDNSQRSIVVNQDDLIRDEMVEAFRQRYGDSLSGISIVESVGSGRAQDGRKYANVTVMGVNAEYMDAENMTLLTGRNFFDRDNDGYRTTAIVSDKLAGSMFGGDPGAALGQEVAVYMGNEIQSFNIIGVYEYEQSLMNYTTAADEDIRTDLLIPLTTARKLTGAQDGVWDMTVVAAPGVDSAVFAGTISDFFNQYYVNNNTFRVETMAMSSMLDEMNSMLSTVSIGLAVIAGISLLVGGIGVMNIMLVSVTERTREIGTRKAIGATNANIRVQFVVESVIICLIGGAIGTVLGGALGYFGSSLMGAAALPDLSAIALAVGFSMAIGIFFGYYPANKAALLDPIEALRYE